MNTLVIAPHPDDEAIGCGGAILKHTDAGHRVVVVVLTSGELGLKHLPKEEAWRVREGESRAAAGILGTAETHFLRLPDWGLEHTMDAAVGALTPLLALERPGLVYLPHPGDGHPDHRASLPLLAAAIRQVGIRAPMLRGYEVWTPLAEVHHIEDITGVMDRKLGAIRAFPSQLATLRYDVAAVGLNQYRGALSGIGAYGEAFAVLQA